jgi:tetratricopeptide (TPR) repeat protein
MLETLLEYALEQMDQNGEIEEVRRAHVEYYLPISIDWLSFMEGNLSVPGWQPFLDKLVSEMDNLRAASTWLLEHNTEEALVLCTFLSYFWHNHRYHSEARNLLEKALALPGASSKRGYPEALVLSGLLAQVQGDTAAAAARYESAIALLKMKVLEAPSSTATYAVPGVTYSSYLGWALGYLASAAASQEGSAATLDVVVEGVEELRASGNEIALGMAEVGLGTAYAYRAELDKARSTLEEALAIGRRHAARFLITFSTQILGDVARIQGDFKSAAALYQESLLQSREIGIDAEMSATLHNMAYAELGQGNSERARELFMESAAAQRDSEHKGAIAETLAGFGALAAYEGHAERAMRLYGAARAVWESNHLGIWPAEQAEYERYMSRARAEVDETSGKRAWEEGYATSIQTLEQALDHALEDGQDKYEKEA